MMAQTHKKGEAAEGRLVGFVPAYQALVSGGSDGNILARLVLICL